MVLGADAGEIKMYGFQNIKVEGKDLTVKQCLHHFALALISQEREKEYMTMKVGRQLCRDLQTVCIM